MGNPLSTQSVSRRAVVGGAAVAGIAATVQGIFNDRLARADEAPSGNAECSFMEEPAPIDEAQIVEDVDCDIVIVGAGVAGMGGIMYAAQQGANVHVLEKGTHEGVHRLSIAGINGQGIIDAADGEAIDVREYTQDYMRYAGGFQAKMNIVSRYAKDSGKFINWVSDLIGEYGWSLIPFGGLSPKVDRSGFWTQYSGGYWFVDPDGNNISMGVSPNWMKLFRQISEDKGATFHFDEPAVRLVREGDKTGRVTSVISQSKIDGAYRRYNAKLGVLLAAGDFFNDKEMVHKYCPHLEKCVSSICEPNDTGDMHKAGLWVGATMDDYSAGDLFAFENASCNNWVAPEPGEPGYTPAIDSGRGCMWAAAVSGMPVLWVDDAGYRFVNEDQYLFQQAGAQAVLGTTTGRAWSIWDGAWERKFPEGWQESPSAQLVAMGSINTQDEIEREIEAGLIQRYDTLEELAEGCGFDAGVFKETIERYNYLCGRGEDLDCFKAPEWMTAIDEPPYYAAQWGVMITSTRSGLKTDERGRVTDTSGRPIPGLYAAGNNGGNFYGIIYPASMGGTGIGHGQFYAWTAVRDMLGEDVIYTEE